MQTKPLLFVTILLGVLGALNSAKAQLPAPTLLSPANNAQIPLNQTQPVRLEWTPVAGADGYQVNIIVTRPNANPSLLSPVIVNETFAEVNLNLTDDDINTQVSWAVQPLAEGTSSGNVARASFTVITFVTPSPTPNPLGLPAPDLVQPDERAVFTFEEAFFGNNQAGLAFEWKAVSGADAYTFLLYPPDPQLDAEPSLRKTVETITHAERIATQLSGQLFQWEVRSIDAEGREGQPGLRRSFQIIAESFPTPTPFPLTPDVNDDGTISAEDVYRFSRGFFTNDPRVDFDRSGLNDARDILLFIQQYQQLK